MWVASALTDSSPSLDDSRGLSLLSETEYESMLRCLSCWQREYRYQTSVTDPQVSHITLLDWVYHSDFATFISVRTPRMSSSMQSTNNLLTSTIL